MREIVLFSFVFAFLLIVNASFSQTNNNHDMEEKLPYSELPDAPERYTPEAVAARLVDALGFRYYWATEGLIAEDLEYRPTPEARSSMETLEHIYVLVQIIKATAQQKPFDREAEIKEMDFAELRAETLKDLKLASELLHKSEAGTLDGFPVQLKKGEDMIEKPFWNIINGMITDAVNHVGQVVSFRRTSGNPVLKRVSYFSGDVK